MPFDNVPMDHDLPTETAHILEHVTQLLLKPRRWGKSVLEAGPWWNRRYCVVGALVHVTRRHHSWTVFPEVRDHLNTIANRHGFMTIEALNDHEATTHGFLMQVLQEAIDQADVRLLLSH